MRTIIFFLISFNLLFANVDSTLLKIFPKTFLEKSVYYCALGGINVFKLFTLKYHKQASEKFKQIPKDAKQ
jgi:hypothetical protein